MPHMKGGCPVIFSVLCYIFSKDGAKPSKNVHSFPESNVLVRIVGRVAMKIIDKISPALMDWW